MAGYRKVRSCEFDGGRATMAGQGEFSKMIIEMRTYKLKAGKREEFLEIFRRRSIPELERLGMKILGPFLSVENPDTFFFMRGFPTREARDPLKASFYEGALWKQELEHKLMPMIEHFDVVLVDDPEQLVHW
jgi:hypothetical protein